MKKLWILSGLFFIIACNKQQHDIGTAGNNAAEESAAKGGGRPPILTTFTTYTIRQGQHYCDQNTITAIATSEMKFIARFDSSAIYESVIPENQYDINKLWGFSEGFNHQYNSARIGWAWNNGALRLYAYAYAKGVRLSQEITPVAIGQDINCGIKVTATTYVFTVNGVVVTLQRGATGTQARGYQLYPYFGGDETAPHLITILIRNA